MPLFVGKGAPWAENIAIELIVILSNHNRVNLRSEDGWGKFGTIKKEPTLGEIAIARLDVIGDHASIDVVLLHSLMITFMRI